MNNGVSEVSVCFGYGECFLSKLLRRECGRKPGHHVISDAPVRYGKCGDNMTEVIKTAQSAPECQLTKVGTPRSYDTLLKSTRTLSDEQLHALEDDLRYYEETGLIGVSMSRLLVLIQPESSPAAA